MVGRAAAEAAVKMPRLGEKAGLAPAHVGPHRSVYPGSFPSESANSSEGSKTLQRGNDIAPGKLQEYQPSQKAIYKMERGKKDIQKSISG